MASLTRTRFALIFRCFSSFPSFCWLFVSWNFLEFYAFALAWSRLGLCLLQQHHDSLHHSMSSSIRCVQQHRLWAQCSVCQGDMFASIIIFIIFIIINFFAIIIIIISLLPFFPFQDMWALWFVVLTLFFLLSLTRGLPRFAWEGWWGLWLWEQGAGVLWMVRSLQREHVVCLQHLR